MCVGIMARTDVAWPCSEAGCFESDHADYDEKFDESLLTSCWPRAYSVSSPLATVL